MCFIFLHILLNNFMVGVICACLKANVKELIEKLRMEL